MHFVDECELIVEAGAGGNGAVAFRREKYVPLGGPAGGDGGRGGDVVCVGDEGLGTLQDLSHQKIIRAERGVDGGGKDMYGRAGADVVVRVPPGTVVFDADTREHLFDITHHAERVIVAKGGIGGRGNKHFATSVDRAPRRAELGQPGERRRVRLELKVMADVGLVGFPNVGKSTFIRAVSRARPKVADYPFTTLAPHLGVVTVGDPAHGGTTFVIADIPGLIEGASEGAGLGHRFLRHIERTRALLYLVSLSDEPGRSPVLDFHALRRELGNYDPGLLERPALVAMTKSDVTEVREAFPSVQGELARTGVDVSLISSVAGDGVDELLRALAKMVTSRPD